MVFRALHRFLECAYGLTSQHCGDKGKSASEFLRSYTEKAVGSLITSTCRKLPTDSKSQSRYSNRVVEIDEADGLREVNVQEDATTAILPTSTRPPRSQKSRGPKKDGAGRRSKSTLPDNTATTPRSRLAANPDPARSQQASQTDQNSPKKNAAAPSTRHFWSPFLPLFSSIFIHFWKLCRTRLS
jgi:hypothetical protein